MFKVKQGAFFLGILLLGINVMGLILPLQNPDIFREQGKLVRNKTVITEKEFYQKIQRQGESIPEFASRLNSAVNERLVHYRWEREYGKDYWLLPFYENYLLYLSRDALWVMRWATGSLDRLDKPPVFMYEFSDYKKVVERGVGLCSQHAIVLVSLLKENHIPSKIVGLNMHTVTIAQIDPKADTWWVLDPDYGVVVPHSLKDIEANPSIVASYYEAKGFDKERVALVVRLYTTKATLIDGVAEAHGKARYYFEFVSYYLIWIIPIFLMLPRLWASIRFHCRATPERQASEAVGCES